MTRAIVIAFGMAVLAACSSAPPKQEVAPPMAQAQAQPQPSTPPTVLHDNPALGRGYAVPAYKHKKTCYAHYWVDSHGQKYVAKHCAYKKSVN